MDVNRPPRLKQEDISHQHVSYETQVDVTWQGERRESARPIVLLLTTS